MGGEIPNQILTAAEGRPMLRLRNIHPELNGMDLSNLFLNIAAVDFVKFDPRNETIAYVCFQDNFVENNSRAIDRFDGKKAMGNVLTVESATSLSDRIAPSLSGRIGEARDTARPRPNGRRNEQGRRSEERKLPEERAPREQHRAKAKAVAKGAARRAKPVAKTAEELDDELTAYMNASANATADPGVAGSDDVPVADTGAFAAVANGEAMD